MSDIAGQVADKDNVDWMYPTLPASIVVGPLTTLISLYILNLGGGILEVSYAITLASVITIPSVFLWGFVTDMLNKRKVFIIFAYLATTLLLAVLYLTNTVPEVILLYAAITFVSAATAAPINLLVMETGAKIRWATNFSTLQTIAAIGTTFGLVAGFVMASSLGLHSLIAALALFSLISTVMALRLVTEPAHSEKSRSISEEMHSFVYILAGIPNLLIRIPNPRNITKVFRFAGLRKLERNFVVVFYVVSFLFFFGTSVFNTEYAVGLRLAGLNESTVFLVILFAMIVQTIMLYYYKKFTINSDKVAISVASLALRGAGYAVVGIAFLFMKGTLFLTFNILFYALAGGIAYSLYYPTAYGIFFDTLSGKSKGSTIGIYTALIGAGTFAGALVSGSFSVLYGFGFTFVIAGLLMFLSAGVFRMLPTRQ